MFKRGMKVTLKNWGACENLDKKFNGPGFNDSMLQYFRKTVTLSEKCSSYDEEDRNWWKIEEDNGYASWDIHWMEEYPMGVKSSEWNFFDSKIDFNQVCLDAMEAKKVCWLVVGDNKAYIGGLPSPLKVDVNSKLVLNQECHYPYIIVEIPIEDVALCIKSLRQYSIDYKAWKKSLDDNIKDRSREKDRKKFKVISF